MTTQYVTVEIGTQSCARGRVFNGRGLVRGYNGRWLGRRDDGHINRGRCRNLLSTDSRLNRIDPSTNIFPSNPERGYRTKFEILLEEVFPNSIE